MLGSGRPFLVEVQNARHVPSLTSVREFEAKVNNAGNGLVSHLIRNFSFLFTRPS